jgi:hypothetical protein
MYLVNIYMLQVNSTPNDQGLGAKVRELINDLKK